MAFSEISTIEGWSPICLKMMMSHILYQWYTLMDSIDLDSYSASYKAWAWQVVMMCFNFSYSLTLSFKVE